MVWRKKCLVVGCVLLLLSLNASNFFSPHLISRFTSERWSLSLTLQTYTHTPPTANFHLIYITINDFFFATLRHEWGTFWLPFSVLAMWKIRNTLFRCFFVSSNVYIHANGWKKNRGQKSVCGGNESLSVCISTISMRFFFNKHKHILCRSSNVIATDEKIIFSLFSFSLFLLKPSENALSVKVHQVEMKWFKRKKNSKLKLPALFISISSSRGFCDKFSIFPSLLPILCVFECACDGGLGARTEKYLDDQADANAGGGSTDFTIFWGLFIHIPFHPSHSHRLSDGVSSRSLFFPSICDETKNEGGMGGECRICEIFWEQDLNWRESMSMREKEKKIPACPDERR